MKNNALLFGIGGFLAGGLIVALSATTIYRPAMNSNNMMNGGDRGNASNVSSMSMDDMTKSLQGKTGDEFDKAFINEMIAHHQGAVAMAKLAATNAKHDEVKNLAENIITVQEKEISEMQGWQAAWGYTGAMKNQDNGMMH